MRVCHVSSVHHGLDVRIFRKECVTLAQGGYTTCLITNAVDADVAAARSIGVDLIPIYPESSRREPGGRLKRLLFTSPRALAMAMKLRADIYHIHDPELLPLFLLASVLRGSKVIYDSHENVFEDILSKRWISGRWLRHLVAGAVRRLEDLCGSRFAAIVTATPHIARRFARSGIRAEVINNFPIVDELFTAEGRLPGKELRKVCYVGGISERRGILELVQAIGIAEVPLVLAGEFESPGLRAVASALDGWVQVEEVGSVSRERVKTIMAESFAGVVTFLSSPNHRWSQPNKMFEYMSAGLPVVASNFPLWREIIEKHGCGICVDPAQPGDIASALTWLRRNPAKAQKMGENGRRLVLTNFSWETQGRRLLALYRDILSPSSGASPQSVR